MRVKDFFSNSKVIRESVRTYLFKLGFISPQPTEQASSHLRSLQTWFIIKRCILTVEWLRQLISWETYSIIILHCLSVIYAIFFYFRSTFSFSIFPLSPFCPSRLIIFLIQLEIRIYGATFGGAYFPIKLLLTSDSSQSQVAALRQRHAIFVFNSEIVFMIL